MSSSVSSRVLEWCMQWGNYGHKYFCALFYKKSREHPRPCAAEGIRWATRGSSTLLHSEWKRTENSSGMLISSFCPGEDQLQWQVTQTGQVGSALVPSTSFFSFLVPFNKSVTYNFLILTSYLDAFFFFVPAAYNKPHLITHQFLEPERVKDLSRSSPLLLSEVGWCQKWLK